MKTVTLLSEDVYKGHLVLVNGKHPLRKKFIQSVRLISFDEKRKDILLDTKTTILLTQLFEFIGSNDEIVPVSGFRTRAEQEKIYQESLIKNGRAFTEKYVALPDRSEHQTGLAIDLGKKADVVDFICPDFPYTGTCGNFRRRAADFGFIERYAKGKEAITGISHEPWHFRYVGYPHSKVMQDNNLSLEEYIHFIKDYPFEGKHFRICEKPREIEVFYIRADIDTTAIQLSEKACFQISGNNVDGFIVTLWR